MTVNDWLENDELALKIWHDKYQHNDESFTEWIERISAGNEELKQLILDKKFLFGGRILAGRGVTDKKVSLSNCYVLPMPEDSLESIFRTASEMAKTFSYGGGVGIDLSNLRPKGAPVNNAAKTTCGPVGFMDLYSQVTNTIGQAGRRAALMLSLDIQHPDIEEFIDIKTDLSKVNFANISVRTNDTFMRAVINDEDYILSWPCSEVDFNYETDAPYNKLQSTISIQGTQVYYKRVKAKKIFEKLAKNNWNYAEPGVLYWDRISKYNLQSSQGLTYDGVNP